MAQRSIDPEFGADGNDSLSTFHAHYSQRDLLAKTTRFANRLLGDRDDAEDAALTGYFRVARKVANQEGYIRNWDWLGAYCFRAVHNICVDMCRRKDHFPVTSFETPVMTDEGIQVLGCLFRDNNDPYAVLDVRLVLDEAINKLHSTWKEPVVLHDLFQMTSKEAAEILGISTPAFKCRLYRGRNQLRELLKEDDGLTGLS